MDRWVWILPVLFALHDLEEIASISWWSKRLDMDAIKKSDRVKDRILRKLARLEASRFAVAVLEEMVILTIVCVVAIGFSTYGLWWGFFLAYAFHLVIHLIQAAYMRSYIPGLIFALLELPICIWIIKQVGVFFSLTETLLWGLLGIVVMLVNLRILHRWMEKETV